MRELYDRNVISKRVYELATKINKKYGDESLVVIGILNGSFMFIADLVRFLRMPIELDFFGVKSYKGTKSSNIHFTKELDIDIKDKHVLIVEDIVDSGMTTFVVCEMLKSREPKSLRLCTLLFKAVNFKKAVHMDWIGFAVPDEFIVGYGLDYNGLYRDLPDIHVLDESDGIQRNV